jgi:hypothetical protein
MSSSNRAFAVYDVETGDVVHLHRHIQVQGEQSAPMTEKILAYVGVQHSGKRLGVLEVSFDAVRPRGKYHVSVERQQLTASILMDRTR